MSDDQGQDEEIRELYRRVLGGWNDADAEKFAASFADDGVVIGFDGSPNHGRDTIAKEMGRIFADHPTGRYVGKVKSVRPLGPNVVLLGAVAGVIPDGESDIKPELNQVQSLLAERSEGEWRVVLYHNTPAQFHGRSDLVEELSEELRREI